jgi:hypothetical protein
MVVLEPTVTISSIPHWFRIWHGRFNLNQSQNILICEIKKDIIYRKYLHTQNPRLNNIIYTPQRVSQHIEIICNRLVSLRQYQGRSTDVYSSLVEIVQEMYWEFLAECATCPLLNGLTGETEKFDQIRSQSEPNWLMQSVNKTFKWYQES